MTAANRIVVDEATQKRAEMLRSLGFVHVTGLSTWSTSGSSYSIQANRKDLGRWDYNNGKTAITTLDGEVWLAAGRIRPPCDICPNGEGMFVPCSNGEQIGTHAVLRRVVDSYDDIHGENSPVPQIDEA